VINHPGPTKETDYLAAMPSNHPHLPVLDSGLYPSIKTWPITTLYCIFGEPTISQHPPIQEPLPVERRIAESLSMRGGARERSFLPSRIDAGLCTIGTRRISNDPPAPHGHNPRHMARDYRSGTDGDNGSRSLTQSCHSVMKKDRELDEEVSGN
jgi:hypothetical protein